MRDEPKELEDYLYEEGDLLPEDLFAPVTAAGVEEAETDDMAGAEPGLDDEDEEREDGVRPLGSRGTLSIRRGLPISCRRPPWSWIWAASFRTARSSPASTASRRWSTLARQRRLFGQGGSSKSTATVAWFGS